MTIKSQSCPCGSGHSYQDCCQPLHLGKQQAETAELLMRSRYSAFVLGLIPYLQATLHPSMQQADDAETLEETIVSTRWLGLQIIASPTADNQRAEVEFIAFYDASPFGQLHERSRFIYEGGRWFYLDGTMLPPVKLARNEPCFCGSGKKFKRCHG